MYRMLFHPLTLLNQPAKQKATSKAEVQRKGQVLENTLKDFGGKCKSDTN
ncbi:DNA translocase FtsK [Staphylococcus aureus]|nr:DNA translocase FtsK [Staphylococcus aureus]